MHPHLNSFKNISRRIAFIQCLFVGLSAYAIEFSIEAGIASETIKEFGKQSQKGLIYHFEDLKDIKTNPVFGNFSSREALEQLLKDTNLVIKEDEETGAFAVVLDPEAVTSNLSSGLSGGNPVTANTNPSEKKLMNRKTNESRLVKWLAGLASAFTVVAPTAVNAQNLTEDEDIYLLSPFVIETEEDIGYLATSTLAGTRIKTNLSDIATSISVITEEFLEDTGSDNVAELLVYTTNTEVAGLGGNVSLSDLTGNDEASDQRAVRSVNSQQRLRGLAPADLTRNFFETGIPFDSYNTQRVEINRGANAALFGLGSPAGIINNTLKVANFNDETVISGAIGSFGSKRSVLDVNRQIIEDKLAIRAIGLYDDNKYRQDPAFRRDKRIFATTTYTTEFFEDSDFLDATTVRVNFEYGSISSNNPRILPPTDKVTPWFVGWTDDYSQFYEEAGFVHPGPQAIRVDASVTNTRDWGGLDAISRATLRPTQATGRGVHIIFPDHNSSVPGDVSSSRYGENIIGRQNTLSNKIFSQAEQRLGTGVHWTTANLRHTLNGLGVPTAIHNLYQSPVVMDPSIFDFNNVLIDGPNKGEGLDFEAFNFTVEQLFLNGNAGIEFAYDNQLRESENWGMLGSGFNLKLSIDVNTVLMDGTPNANFGRPFIADEGYIGYSRDEDEVYRLTAFYDLKFSERDGLVKWLGDHLITFSYSDTEQYSEQRGGRPFSTGIDYTWGRSVPPVRRTDNHRNAFSKMHYLGGSLENQSVAAGANIPGIQALQVPNAATRGSGRFLVSQDGDRDDGFHVETVTVDEEIWRSANKDLIEIESAVLVLQSFLLNRNLIGTFAWREDEISTLRAVQSPELGGGNSPFRTDLDLLLWQEEHFSVDYATEADIEESSIFSYGLVAAVPFGWMEKVPYVDDLRFHYNESENFTLGAGRVNAFGESVPAPKGETKDYGFSLTLFDNKLYLKANWYESSQNFLTFDSGPGLTTPASLLINARSMIGIRSFDEDGDGLPEIDTNGDGVGDQELIPLPQEYLDLVNYDPVGNVATGLPGFVRTFDRVAEGFELEAVYNPTPNWTIAFNAARQEATNNNSAQTLQRYFEETTVNVNGQEFGIIELFATGGPNAAFPQFDAPGEAALAAAQADRALANFSAITELDGQLAQELREWRYNFITNYKFDEGSLAGINVGGAYRWQDKAAIGYEFKEAADGTLIPDINAPFFGPTEDNIDVWVGYTRPIMDEKVNWKIQLNIRNLLDDDDLIPVAANPNGAVYAARIVNPLTWELRSSFTF